jgi:hypothetical protein
MGDENVMIRMTGCPNGCGRPYMVEIGYVGDGRDTYQLWVGGSPTLDGRTGFALLDRVKDKNMEATLAPLFAYWRDSRHPGEAFGDFTHRKGKEDLLAFIDGYTVTDADLQDEKMYDENAETDSDESVAEISPVVTQDELNAQMAAAKRPAGPEATAAAMEARVAEDKEVAKETVLGQVTRVKVAAEVSEEAKAADKAKAEADKAAEEEKPKTETKAEVKAEPKKAAMTPEAIAAVKAAAAFAATVTEEQMAAEMKSAEGEKAGAGLTRAHKAAGAERLRVEEEKEALAEASSEAAAQAVAEHEPVHTSVPPSAAGAGLIREVFAYRVFKNNPQWCVEWAADNAVSWETLDKLDSEHLREKALALQKSAA